ncbi:hypothetical protein TNCV_2197421 [Trichonephila clavipes]|nr:hypothetical protein TNCV_2197421 [Trichonephila clavipes]
MENVLCSILLTPQVPRTCVIKSSGPDIGSWLALSRVRAHYHKKPHRVGDRWMLNLSRDQTSSLWCGVVVRREGCQLRCRPGHLTMVQNYVVRR